MRRRDGGVQIADDAERPSVLDMAIYETRVSAARGSRTVPAASCSRHMWRQDWCVSIVPEEKVEFHSFAMLKGELLSTMFGVESQLRITGESDLVQAVRDSTQQNVTGAGDQITTRNFNI